MCDVLINKRQLYMMLTAGWSGPRHNPPQLLLTFQRPGAYPRRRAQSSLSRSSSVQGSGGGRLWPSLSYQLQKNTHSAYTFYGARTPCRYCITDPAWWDALTLSHSGVTLLLPAMSTAPQAQTELSMTMRTSVAKTFKKLEIWF